VALRINPAHGLTGFAEERFMRYNSGKLQGGVKFAAERHIPGSLLWRQFGG
jgi:hypothetical protein